MGFFADLGRQLRQGLDGLIQTGQQLVRVTAPVVQAFIKKARELADDAAKRFQRAWRDVPKNEREFVERQLQEVNDRIFWLRAQHRQHGSLSETQRTELQRLKPKREQLIADLEGLDAVDLAAKTAERGQDYDSHTVTDKDAHLIDMVTGQSTYGKVCKVCGRTMVLQWDRGIQTLKLSDFFWGCSGWYIQSAPNHFACKYRERLSSADFNIFADLKRPEFSVSAEGLTRQVLDPGRKRRLREALDAIQVEHRKSNIGIAQYRCPVHGESLRLQRKRNVGDNLLDEYFLGCPRWLPRNEGCNFLIKLKSPGRISSVIDLQYGKGVLEMMDG